MDYSITARGSGSQTISFRVAGPGGKLRVQKADGTVLATVTLPVTAGGQIYATGSATISLPAGKQTLRIVALTAGWNFNWFELSGGAATTVPPTTTNPTTPTTPTTPTAPSTGANVALYSAFEDASDFNKWIKEICRTFCAADQQRSTGQKRQVRCQVRIHQGRCDQLQQVCACGDPPKQRC